MVVKVSRSASSLASFPYRATFGRGSGDIVTQFSPSRSATRDAAGARKFPEGKRRETTNRSNARRSSITFRASVLAALPFFSLSLSLRRSSRGASPLRRLIPSPESPLVLRSSLPVIQFRRVFQVRQGVRRQKLGKAAKQEAQNKTRRDERKHEVEKYLSTFRRFS